MQDHDAGQAVGSAGRDFGERSAARVKAVVDSCHHIGGIISNVALSAIILVGT